MNIRIVKVGPRETIVFELDGVRVSKPIKTEDKIPTAEQFEKAAKELRK